MDIVTKIGAALAILFASAAALWAKAAKSKENEIAAKTNEQALEDIKHAQAIEKRNADTAADKRRERLRNEYAKK